MDLETVRCHINQQLCNIMIADMDVGEYLETALTLTNHCLDESAGKYYANRSGKVNVYHSVQYMMLLYWLSRVMYQKDNSGINAEKVYYLRSCTNRGRGAIMDA